ncbi:MAG: hypothetical protein U9O64_03910 [Campylobacterota bacterium]|nr:hypothetical protein [Campylobacterota bacterium]
MLCYYLCGTGVAVSIVILIGLMIAYFRTQNISTIHKAKYIVRMLVITGTGYIVYMVYLMNTMELISAAFISSLTPIGIILASFIVTASMNVSIETLVEIEKKKANRETDQDPLEAT